MDTIAAMLNNWCYIEIMYSTFLLDIIELGGTRCLTKNIVYEYKGCVINQILPFKLHFCAQSAHKGNALMNYGSFKKLSNISIEHNE